MMINGKLSAFSKVLAVVFQAVLFTGCFEKPELFVPNSTDNGSKDAGSLSEENTADACDDLIDNDGDGLTDCDDDECSVFVVCSTDSTDNSSTDSADSGPSDADTDTNFDSDTDTAPDADTDTDSNTDTPEGLDTALFVNKAPTVDGILDEEVWRLNTSVKKIVSGETTDWARFDALWNNKKLYIAVEVIDENICVGVDIASWNYDSVEIFLDPDNSKSTTYDRKDVHMIFKYMDEDWVEYGASVENKAPVEMLGSLTESGYVVEMSIPWAGLGVIPSAGIVVGFDVGVNDDDETCGSRDAVLRWFGTDDNYQDTSVFGELSLSSSQADSKNARAGVDPSEG